MKLGIDVPMHAVFTTESATIPFEDICNALAKRRRPGEHFIVLSEDGEMRSI